MKLDIGSGYNPWPEADVIADKYLDNVSRGSDLVIPEGKKFVQCDIESRTPFADKQFDFVRAASILEHVSEPHKACEEMSRIGKAGLIVTPTFVWETLFGREYHLWTTFTTEIDGKNVLVFRPNKTKKNGFRGDWLYTNIKEFEQEFEKNKPPFEVRYEWEGEIYYRVEGNAEEDVFNSVIATNLGV